MKVIIIASGSRGDVQPYVALGSGLRQAGHTVGIVSTGTFRSLCESYGLDFVDIGVDTSASIEAMRGVAEQGNLFEIIARTGQGAQQLATHTTMAGLSACKDADLILGGFAGLSVGLALSEKLGIPFLQAHLMPITPTSAFPAILTPLPNTPLSPWLNRVSHRLTQQALWMMLGSADRKVRTDVLHLPTTPFWGPFAKLEHQKLPILYGYSQHVLPRPNDWQHNIDVTGYWFLEPPAGWQPPGDLVAFLEAGPPPIYIGFGSMSSSKPEETTRLVLEALARSGQRGLISAGWGGLQQTQLPENVFMAGDVFHHWLFPQMAAIVHHGGAGTTAASVAAGVPSIITPFFGDQPFWGRRIQALGVGPQPISRRRLSVENLAGAIDQAMSNRLMRARAAELGQRVRAEDGIQRAVRVIEQYVR